MGITTTTLSLAMEDEGTEQASNDLARLGSTTTVVVEATLLLPPALLISRGGNTRADDDDAGSLLA